MDEIWKIYGLSSILIVLLSIFLKPKQTTMNKIWKLYAFTPLVIMFINLLRGQNNKN